LATLQPIDEQLTELALATSGLALPDDQHARRSARFAGDIFDALHDRLDLAPDDRRLAVLAALFHDVGYARDVRDHQRKSFDMLREAELPTLSAAEREIVAAVARYHRKSLPNIEHAGFGFMSSNDQRRVRRLSGVVRLAVALDASHLGVVQSVDVRPEGEPIVLTAHATDNVEVERDRLRENAAAFTHLTQLPLRADIVVSRR
jgi:exopolyphosphatase/guanosine-5'-triphosphate,3'-diphosphate pyrophosphatase